MERRRKLPLGSLLAYGGVIFSLILLIMGFKSSREKYQDFVEVDAVVTNITKSTENNPNKIEYKYKYDGKNYTVERNEAFRNGKKIGDTATIKCNPKNPSEVQDDSDTFFFITIFMFSVPVLSLIVRFIKYCIAKAAGRR